MSVIEPTAFTTGSVERAAARGADEAWLAEARSDPSSRLLLVRGADVASVDDGLELRAGADDEAAVLLGMVGGAAWFAAPAADDDPGSFTSLRELAGALAPGDAQLAATAVGLLG